MAEAQVALRAVGHAWAEIDTAFVEHGWRGEARQEGPWHGRRSMSAPGELAIAARRDGGFLVRAPTNGVTEALAAEGETVVDVDGVEAFAAAVPAELRRLASRCYQLAVSLPHAPLDEYRRELAESGIELEGTRGTEAEALVRRRLGQEKFRKALMNHWGGVCPLTGIAEPALLRASHIVPWSACDDDAHRLSVFNGLLLSALWDAAFDGGLVSFDDDGRALASATLTEAALTTLRPEAARIARLSDEHRRNLARHREHVFDRVAGAVADEHAIVPGGRRP